MIKGLARDIRASCARASRVLYFLLLRPSSVRHFSFSIYRDFKFTWSFMELGLRFKCARLAISPIPRLRATARLWQVGLSAAPGVLGYPFRLSSPSHLMLDWILHWPLEASRGFNTMLHPVAACLGVQFWQPRFPLSLLLPVPSSFPLSRPLVPGPGLLQVFASSALRSAGFGRVSATLAGQPAALACLFVSVACACRIAPLRGSGYISLKKKTV